MTDINRLQGIFRRNDSFAPSTRYKIILPPILPTVDLRDLNVLCKSANIPGFSVTSKPSRTNMLPIEVPTGFVKDPCDMQFVETGKYTVMKYFDFWMKRIVNKNQYYVKYRKDIAFDVIIFAEKVDGSNTYMCRLRNAWPKIRSKLGYSGNSDGEPITVDISWEYEDLHTENLDVSFADLGLNLAADFILDSGFEVANTIRKATDKIDDIRDAIGRIF